VVDRGPRRVRAAPLVMASGNPTGGCFLAIPSHQPDHDVALWYPSGTTPPLILRYKKV
jgi:hypothetical protein